MRAALKLILIGLSTSGLGGCTYQAIEVDAPDVPPRSAVDEPEDWEKLLPGQIEQVRSAVKEWRDFDAAKAAGWKPFGGEEPLMGRHYYNDDAPDYQFGDALDFSEPNNLMYAEIDGRLTLTGVAYVVRIGPDEPVPAGFAGPEDEWHVHDLIDSINAATEDRPFLRSLASWWLNDTYFAKGDYRHRLAMVHVWTEWPNPDGDFANYDRTLPYRKLGLPAEWAEGVSLETARGVHLASASGCKDVIDGKAWIGNFSRKQKKALRSACKAAAERIASQIERGPDALNRVATIAWQDYLATYAAVVSDEQQRRIAAMTEHSHHAH